MAMDDEGDAAGPRTRVRLDRPDRMLRALATGDLAARWWIAIAVVGAALVLLEPVIGLPGPARGWWLAQRLVELWIVGGIVAVALGPVLRWGPRRTMPKAPTVAAMVLAGALIVSQHGPARLDLYPFVEWGMYTTTTERIFYTEYLLVRNGRVEPDAHVRIDETVPTSMRAFMRRLDGHAEAAAAGDESALEVVEETLDAIVPRDQRLSSDAVMIQECEIRAPWSSQPVRCEEMLTVALPAGDR